MYLTQALERRLTETNILVFTEACMWLMMFFWSRRAWPEYGAVRVAHAVNKYADDAFVTV